MQFGRETLIGVEQAGVVEPDSVVLCAQAGEEIDATGTAQRRVAEVVDELQALLDEQPVDRRHAVPDTVVLDGRQVVNHDDDDVGADRRDDRV